MWLLESLGFHTGSSSPHAQWTRAPTTAHTATNAKVQIAKKANASKLPKANERAQADPPANAPISHPPKKIILPITFSLLDPVV
jgi:hypothetical protein